MTEKSLGALEPEEFDNYEEVPSHLVQGIVAEVKREAKKV